MTLRRLPILLVILIFSTLCRGQDIERDRFVSQAQTYINADESVQRLVGIDPAHPRYSAFLKGFEEMFANDVLIGAMYDALKQAGLLKDASSRLIRDFTREWMVSMSRKGVQRLDTEDQAFLLAARLAYFESIPTEQCGQQLKSETVDGRQFYSWLAKAKTDKAISRILKLTKDKIDILTGTSGDDTFSQLSQAINAGNHSPEFKSIEEELNKPPSSRQHQLLELTKGNNFMTIEIAARMFIEDYPEHPLGWQVLGGVLHNSGKLKEALKVEQETVNRFQQDANAHNNLALTQVALGKYKAGLISVKRALKINPNLQEAKRLKAQIVETLEKAP